MTPALRVAVIGAGPSGIYVAGDLLKRLPGSVEIDVIDRLLTPWGLVRHGVAPDHPQIKSVTRAFDAVANRPGFRFFGGVHVGNDVGPEDLHSHYDAVVYTVGAERPAMLDIPGRGLPGSVGAGAFVGWYNGHPDHRHDEIALDTERVVVIGNGNVAIDCARILMKSPDDLAKTDIADHALAALRASAVREVVVVGRRGPAEAAYTTVELAELGTLPNVAVRLHPGSVDIDDAKDVKTKLLRDISTSAPATAEKRITFRFHTNVAELTGRDRVEAASLRSASETHTVRCGLVIHAIGFNADAIGGLPVSAGRLDHVSGRVAPGVYAAGWFKRGPSGIIGTNKKCATETVNTIMADIDTGSIQSCGVTAAAAETWLRSRCPDLMQFDDWRAIDAAEIAAGASHGRPRVKFDVGRHTAIARRTHG